MTLTVPLYRLAAVKAGALVYVWDVVAELQVTVSNTGAVPGTDVVQVFPYVKGVQFPAKVLRGFEKVHLDAREQWTPQFNITRHELRFLDMEAQRWRAAVEGKFKI